MNKIYLIIEREFLVRVKKKSFILTTVLVPLLLASLMIVPFLIQSIKDTEHKNIAVIDRSGLAQEALENTDELAFTFYNNSSLDSLKTIFKQENLYAIVSIGELHNNTPAAIDMYAFKQPNLDVQKSIEKSMERVVERRKLDAYNIPGLDTIMNSINTRLDVKTFVWDENGDEKASHSSILMGLSYILSFMIYMFIFMFGSMIMRSVIEEKNNRIIEVIISSVKPFQLMLGKIIGVASVGLLQFIIWIVLTLGITTVIGGVFGADSIAPTPVAGQEEVIQQATKELGGKSADILAMIAGINFIPIIISFIFFFLFGYLLYASMFAAIGSAVENETDTQQLTIPVTIPLIIGMFLMLHTFQYPDSSLSFWASMIPFTSPMVMMARVPFGVPFWQIALSLSLLFITFLGVVWFAGKIYRVGILMYGKKPSLKEMWKWITYKN